MSDREAYYDALHDRQDKAWKERPFSRDERLRMIKANTLNRLTVIPGSVDAHDKLWLIAQIEALEAELEDILAYSRSKS